MFSVSVAILAFPQSVRPRLPNIDVLKPHFGWLGSERIQKTLSKMTQYYCAAMHYPFCKHFKSRFPAANVKRLREWFATNTLFGSCPAHDDGIPGHGGTTMLQIFAGVDSHFLAGYPMSSEGDYPQAMEDFI